ncbi:lachesin-like [Venturia canescens]|uniref:lachesin-like n=1 Tax=Venturia canescens TaxID=32260 RepID=UPI001C9CED1D|nr:lachesin-like [Venturia canescens]XP_043277288.1 lachesin-like [Venturia canescens]
MAARATIAGILAALLQICSCQITTEVQPEFPYPLENHTVIQGREVAFTCTVNHLQSYKVAWIKADTRAILAIHTHMVAHNPRLSVTHNGHNTWMLHVSNVQKNDSGTYMCQVNTDPMLSQMGTMKVVVPPDIMDDESSDGLVTREGGNITLRCIATGVPNPTVTWRREDGRNIVIREDGQKQSRKTLDGETLNLTGVLRHEMGSYLCIASNGIPPTVSKRYSVQVHFQPLIKVTNQLVAAPINSDVVLQCYVEASPRSMNTWLRDKGDRLLPSDKYTMTEFSLSEYSWQMNLTIHNLERVDFGGYACSAVNALGNAENVVRLQEMELPTKTTPGTMYKNTDTRQRKKYGNTRKKPNRRPHENSEGAGDASYHGNNDEFGTTQIMGGSTKEGHRTERPPTLPSLSPPWVILNGASPRRASRILDNEILPLLLLSASLLL